MTKVQYVIISVMSGPKMETFWKELGGSENMNSHECNCLLDSV